MCGICGITGCNDTAVIRKMNDTLIHRGPDDAGYYIDNEISLGHRRLSIIDLHTGHQPIHNEDETIWIVFNGEIYNFEEIKKDLIPKHHFYTQTDTEVLVHCYEEYGLDFVKHLNGMFSFALWDTVKKRLILARDPIGKKPLYYFFNGNHFIFASEIKAILQTGIKKQIDFNGVCAYLAYEYSLGSSTLFEGIKKIPGGHQLIFQEGKISLKKYWDIPENIQNFNEDEIIVKLKFLLDKSTRYRLISDVPVGAFLSGGLDSSTVVALSRPLVDYPFHTFSLGFETFSELPYAKMVSEHFDTEHHEMIITSEDVIPFLNTIAWHFDEPLGDAAIINNYFLSKEAKKYVKVVLAGEAGDEIFGGYSNYHTNLIYYHYIYKTKLNYFLNKARFLQKLCYNDRCERILSKITQPNFELIHLNSRRVMSNNAIKYYSKLDPENVDANAIMPENIVDPLNKMLAVDCKNLLPERFLMKADKATMANSVEERLPLMDKNIIEFMFSVPYHLKLKNYQEKYLLKMAMKDILPKEILKRKKQGFGTPFDIWLHNPHFRDIVIEEIEKNALIKKYFHQERISTLIRNLKKGNVNRPMETWDIFALALWHSTFFRGEQV
jgi:asparagine synthase (glutamine-hydrolysing)